MSKLRSEPLRRALDIVDLVALSPAGLGAQDVAERLNAPLPTVFRVMEKLRDLGYLQQARKRGPYTIGTRLDRLARSVCGDTTFLEAAARALQELADELHVAAYLAGFFEPEALMLQVRLPTNALAPVVHPGRQFRIHASASGKILLAFQPQSVIDDLLSTALPRLTDKTITDATTLKKHLEEARMRGYAVSAGESDPALWGIAYAVQDAAGMAAYSIGFVTFRNSIGDEQQYIERVRPAMARVTMMLQRAL